MDNTPEVQVDDTHDEDDPRNLAFEVRLIKTLERTPFFAELSRRIRKRPVSPTECPTAGVSWDRKRDDLLMVYNPEFIAGLTDPEFHGLMTHEFYHIILGHVTTRALKPHKRANIAADLATNSLIHEEQLLQRNNATIALPAGGLVPGQWPRMPGGREMTPTEKAANKVAAKIASFPLGETTEWYFARLTELVDELKQDCPVHGGAGPGDGDKSPGESGDAQDKCTCGAGHDGFDDHSGWDDLTEEEREYVAGRVKDMVGKAAKHANSRPDGWGNIPASVRERINVLLNGTINWRAVLRQFIGSVCRAERRATMKRINRKYPYIHAGTKKSHKPKLLVAIDMSGSVGDDALELFFGELSSLTRDVSITVAPFDTNINDDEVFEWRKGSKVQAMRTKCGGTDFNAPTRFANDPARRGQWDGLLIMTDGAAPEPEPSRVKRAWVLAPGCNMYFPTQEAVIATAHADKK